MKKRFLIDLTDLEAWSGQHGGTQRVVYNIVKNFFLKRSDTLYEVEYISFSDGNKNFHRTSFEPIYRRVEKTKVSNRVFRKKTKQFKKQELIFSPQDIVIILGKPWDNPDIQRTLTLEKKKTGFRIVQLVYDLVPCLEPHLQNPVLIEPYTKNMKEALGNSDLMWAISNSTAKDLRLFCEMNKLEQPQVKVIRLGDDVTRTKHPKKPDGGIDKQFIACVGTVEIRKNHSLLYNTYKLAKERLINLPQLVIVGSQGWLTGDTQHLINNDPSTRGQIIMLHEVDDKGLDWVYRNCMFTVYPSKYEGWGLPVAESLNYGKLCISSNASSMPEIAGSLIDYFDPYSTDECLRKIKKYLNAQNLKNKEQGIKAHYRPSSWAETYDQVVDSLKVFI